MLARIFFTFTVDEPQSTEEFSAASRLLPSTRPCRLVHCSPISGLDLVDEWSPFKVFFFSVRIYRMRKIRSHRVKMATLFSPVLQTCASSLLLSCPKLWCLHRTSARPRCVWDSSNLPLFKAEARHPARPLTSLPAGRLVDAHHSFPHRAQSSHRQLTLNHSLRGFGIDVWKEQQWPCGLDSMKKGKICFGIYGNKLQGCVFAPHKSTHVE